MILRVLPGVNPSPLTVTCVRGGPVDGEIVSFKPPTSRSATPKTPDVGSVAVMTTSPVAAPVATPSEPALLEIVASEVSEDDQVTESVRSCVLRSE